MKKIILLILPLVLLSSCKKDSDERNWVAETDQLLEQIQEYRERAERQPHLCSSVQTVGRGNDSGGGQK